MFSVRLEGRLSLAFQQEVQRKNPALRQMRRLAAGVKLG